MKRYNIWRPTKPDSLDDSMSNQKESASQPKQFQAQQQRGERYMPSIFVECDSLKQDYDKCFLSFFQTFVKEDARHERTINPCQQLHNAYRECLDKNLKLHKPYDIDLDDLRKEVQKIDLEKMEDFVQSAANGGISSGVPDQSGESRFNQLERNLELFQENARHMGVIASDFTSKSQEPLNQKIHTLISGLQVLDQLKSQFTDVRVPIELLDYLDNGQNPQLYTKELLERTRQRNKELNGKTEMYRKFQACLLQELHREMPSDVEEYVRIRKPSGMNGAVGGSAAHSLVAEERQRGGEDGSGGTSTLGGQ
uniref:Mediator of RNA polymerase II transcription subunit 10 n=1 Tax=Globodera rostochiensis TaxID=31243 RepID=A0A914HXP4_GLORO